MGLPKALGGDENIHVDGRPIVSVSYKRHSSCDGMRDSQLPKLLRDTTKRLMNRVISHEEPSGLLQCNRAAAAKNVLKGFRGKSPIPF